MADVYKGLTIEFRGDATGLSKALSQIRSESKGVSSELKQIQRAMKFNSSSPALATRQIELMKKQIKSATDQLNVYKTAERDIGKANMSSEAWTKLQSDIAMTEAKLAAFKKQLAETYIQQDAANSVLGRIGTALTNFGNKYEGLGRGMQTVGNTMSRTVTPAIIATGVASVAAAVKIDTSLTNVRKTVDGTEEQYQALKDAAIEFSKTNAVSATEILDIQALGAQLGFAIDELDQFSQVVSGLDIATNMDAEQAATEMAHFANITKMSHDDVERYGSSIVDLGNHYATTESDISSMAMRIAAAGTQIGMSQADILGLAAALSSMGIEAEAGGTAISTIMANIDKAVATGSDSLNTWASTAQMSAEQFANAWRTNPVEALSAVLSGMENAVNEGGNMSLMLDELGVSSLRQTDVLKRLAGNSQLVTDAVRTSNQAWRENTALQNEVDNRNNSLAAKFEMIKNRLTAIADSVGGPLADAFLDVLDAAEPLIQAIEDGAKAFSNMSKEEQQAVLGAVGFAAAIGPILSLVGGGIANISRFGQALTSMAQFFAKIGGAGKQAEAALSGIVTSTTNLGTAGEAASKGLGMTKTALGALKFTGITVAIAAVIAGIAKFTSEMAKYAGHVADFEQATTGLASAADTVYVGAGQVAEGLDQASSSASNAKTNFWELTQSTAEMSQAIAERNQQAGKDIGALEQYRDIIGDLVGKSDLSAEELESLKTAVEGVNQIMGTNFEVVEGFSGYEIMRDGAYQARDAVLALIDAQQVQIQLEADAQTLSDLYAKRKDLIQGVADAEDKAKDATQKYNDECARTGDINNAYRADMEHANQTLADQKEQLLENTRAIDQVTDRQAFLKQSLEEGADAYTKFVANNSEYGAVLEKNGQDMQTFADQLRATGVDLEALGQKGPEAAIALANGYDGSVQSIISGLQELGLTVDSQCQQWVNTASQMAQSSSMMSDAVRMAFIETGVSSDQFTFAMAQAGLSVEQFAALTPQQLSMVVQAFSSSTGEAANLMQIFASQTGQYGNNAMTQWVAGLSSGAQAAVAAALQATGQTLEQFKQGFDQANTDGQLTIEQYAQGLMSGQAEQGGQQAAQQAGDALGNADFSAQGQQAIGTYYNGMGSADAGAVESVKSAVGDNLGSADYTPQGQQAGTSYMSGIGSADPGAAGSLVETVRGTLSSADFTAEGAAAGTSYGNGIGSASVDGASTLVSQALASIQGASSQFQSEGSNAGGQYASGISSQGGAVSGASSGLASNASGPLTSASGTAFSSGSHVGSQFAAGIRSQVGAVSSAASALAAAAAAFIQHSKPKKGPLSVGEDVFGRHLAENFAGGMSARSSIRKVEQASEKLAQTVFDYIGHSQPNKGPLSPGEWTFGVHAAINFADGLGSDQAVNAVSESAQDLADAAAEAWTAGMLAAFKARSGEFQAVTDELGKYVDDTFSQFFDASLWADTRGNGKNVFGIHDAVYDSLADMKNAGYSLDEFIKKENEYQKELADKTAEYQKRYRDHTEKLADIEEQAAQARNSGDVDKAAKQRERSIRSEMESWNDYTNGLKEWKAEYDDFMATKGGLATTDYLWLQENEPLFELSYEINVETGAAQASLKNLAELSKKTGVIFSKEFVEKIADGSEESIALLENLALSSTEDVKQMTLAFEDMGTQQRMAEQAARGLWVNSLQYAKDPVRQLRDLYLDYKDDVLDVTEALYSDVGLSNAFKVAGVSAEQFALDLGSVNMSMEDFTQNFENFTAQVSNGFQAMNSYKQTGLNDWMKNLKGNMAEAQAFAKNLQIVMDKLPDSVDSEAFRKAVIAGGWGEWGHVIADMAKADASNVQEAVELYNQSIIEGQQSAIEQFRALAPGEEYVNALMESMSGAGPALAGEIESIIGDAQAAAAASSGQWTPVGAALIDAVSSGVEGQAGSLAAAAKSAVDQALAAAQSAADAGMASIRAQISAVQREAEAAVASAKRTLSSVGGSSNLRSSQSANVTNNSAATINNNYNVTVRNNTDLRALMDAQNKATERAMKASGMRV